MDEIIQKNSLYLKYIDNILGWGVFTNNDIKKGEVVEYCYCLPEKFSESQHKNYSFLQSKESDNAYQVLGFGMIYNHSYDPNIYWEIVDYQRNVICFTALKDIKAGEELYHNYGEDYWKTRPKKQKTLI